MARFRQPTRCGDFSDATGADTDLQTEAASALLAASFDTTSDCRSTSMRPTSRYEGSLGLRRSAGTKVAAPMPLMRSSMHAPSGIGLFLIAQLLMATTGCASLKLNGCRRLDSCGERGAYVCGGDLICADRDGNTIRSETTYRKGTACRICDGD